MLSISFTEIYSSTSEWWKHSQEASICYEVYFSKILLKWTTQFSILFKQRIAKQTEVMSYVTDTSATIREWKALRMMKWFLLKRLKKNFCGSGAIQKWHHIPGGGGQQNVISIWKHRTKEEGVIQKIFERHLRVKCSDLWCLKYCENCYDHLLQITSEQMCVICTWSLIEVFIQWRMNMLFYCTRERGADIWKFRWQRISTKKIFWGFLRISWSFSNDFHHFIRFSRAFVSMNWRIF